MSEHTCPVSPNVRCVRECTLGTEADCRADYAGKKVGAMTDDAALLTKRGRIVDGKVLT